MASSLRVWPGGIGLRGTAQMRQDTCHLRRRSSRSRVAKISLRRKRAVAGRLSNLRRPAAPPLADFASISTPCKLFRRLECSARPEHLSCGAAEREPDMSVRSIVSSLLLLLAGCSAPDYTAVRDWARTASIAADHPRSLQPSVEAMPTGVSDASGIADSPTEARAAPALDNRPGMLAMQSALATYLSSIAVMASDGVLPYMENPFTELARQAGQTDAGGGQAVAALGAFLRYASRSNMQAPEVRYAFRSADPAVQSLISALSSTVGRECTPGAVACVEARDHYVRLLREIGEGHAFLQAHASRITQAETERQVRAAEDRLRRGMLRLPRRRRAFHSLKRRVGPRLRARRVSPS